MLPKHGSMVLLLIAIFTILEMASLEQRPLVHIQQGTIQGTYQKSLSGRMYVAFQGIPYAKPPIGELRFKDPKKPEPWVSILDASKPGERCLQYSHVSPPNVSTESPLLGSEDCLYMNIFTPQLPTENITPALDVLVHIHGGAFMYGSGNTYSPRFLLDQDIIMVTFNYRVGPLGFLSTEDEVIPGNMGLKDQTAALIWVQQNIAAFGGNPESVTLSGFSAGAASVHYHYLSPLSKGLFKRGFSQSGNALNPWAIMKEGRAKAFKLGELLGCTTKSSAILLKYLQEQPAEKIVMQVPHFQGWLYNPISPFGPTVELRSPNPFLNKHPAQAMIQREIQDIPWMTSVTTHEGLYPAADWIANDKLNQELEERFAELAPHIFDFNYTSIERNKQDIANKIRHHYLKDKPISSHNWLGLVQAIGDRMFVVEAARSIKIQAALNKAAIYFYVFGYRGKYSISDSLSGTNNDFGVSHADDQAYIMDCYFNVQETTEDQLMSRFLVDVLSSFIRTGNPVPQSNGFIWLPVSPRENKLQYLFINSSCPVMHSQRDLGEQQFWDSTLIEEPQMNLQKPIHLQEEL